MAKKSFWPYGIVLSIVAIILACVATIVVAINNPVEMDSAYMQSHQKVDENITFIKESEARFDKKFELKFEPEFKATFFERCRPETHSEVSASVRIHIVRLLCRK